MKDQGGPVNGAESTTEGRHQATTRPRGDVPAGPPSDLEALTVLVDGLAGHIVGAAVRCPTCDRWALVETPPKARPCPHIRTALAQLRHVLEACDVHLEAMPAKP